MLGGEAELVEGAEDVEIGKLDAAAAFAGLHEGADGFDVVEADGTQVAADAFKGAAEEAALDGGGQEGERFDIQNDGFGRRLEVKGFEAVEFAGPVVFFVAGPVGGGGEDVGERGIELRQFGEDIEADTISLVVEVGVGDVFAPGDVVGGEPVADFGSSKSQEGADDAFGGGGADAAEAGGAGAAEEAEEDGFGLIVEGVAGGYGVAEIISDALREEIVAEAPGFLFGVAIGGREGCGVERDGVVGGESADEGFIGVGFGTAEFVIDVEDGVGEVELMEGDEEKDGIGAAGNGYGDFFVGGASGRFEEGGDAVEHLLILRRVLWLRVNGEPAIRTLLRPEDSRSYWRREFIAASGARPIDKTNVENP